MSPTRQRLFVIAAGFLLATVTLPAADAPNPTEVKRITDRYALTKTRINALLGQRLDPTPLPANPPNPFYQPPATLAGTIPAPEHDTAETALVPETADISDIDTLRKYAATLKLGGAIIRNGTAYLTINNMPSKVGDVLTVGHKDHPTYLKIVELTATDLTLALNQATLVVPLKK